MAKAKFLRNVILDTGPLVAILCEADTNHEVCRESLKRIVPPLLTTWPVLTEAAWILRDESKALERLFDPRGLFTVVHQGDEILDGFRAVMKRYRSLSPQLADMSLLQLVEEERGNAVFTLDRRDFTVYRVKGKALHLLPQPL